MRLRFLDTVTKRIGFSFGLSAIILLGMTVFEGVSIISLYTILLVTVCVYIPVTLFYAVASTFFADEEADDELLDN